MSQPREMGERECRRLLAGGGVGRVAFVADDGPHVVPVNFAVIADAVVFRTSPTSLLGTLGWGQRLAFEVDHLDHERWRGWSVVAAGPGELIESAEELSVIRTFWDPRPWAGGERLVYVRLRWDRLTGRQIGSGWYPSDEPAVRRAVGPGAT
jgi:nitroimidazol reductase NimA-like FMN-containing flavoprotein (pyridoxamine 5'-phosphate oxidase superfamily)